MSQIQVYLEFQDSQITKIQYLCNMYRLLKYGCIIKETNAPLFTIYGNGSLFHTLSRYSSNIVEINESTGLLNQFGIIFVISE